MNTTIKAKLKFMNISNLPEKHIANQIIKQQKNKTNMRTIVTLFIAAVFCTACNQNYTNSKESFTKIEKELKENPVLQNFYIKFIDFVDSLKKSLNLNDNSQGTTKSIKDNPISSEEKSE